MKTTTILFDLDGTLISTDTDEFIKTYFKSITKKGVRYRYEPEKLMKSIWLGSLAMEKNDGTKSNKEVFWETFYSQYDESAKKDQAVFDEYYEKEFDEIREAFSENREVPPLMGFLQNNDLRVVLATKPIFPAVAIKKRIYWAGLHPDDFELITTYENSRYCKPNPQYYKEICEKLGVSPKECLMVGNDVDEDMIAETLGMKVFLLTDNLINKSNKNISVYPNGDFDELTAYIERIIE